MRFERCHTDDTVGHVAIAVGVSCDLELTKRMRVDGASRAGGHCHHTQLDVQLELGIDSGNCRPVGEPTKGERRVATPCQWPVTCYQRRAET